MHEHIDDLIAKELSGEITRDEAAELQRWLGESPDNQAYKSQLARLWALAPEVKQRDMQHFDTEKALEKVNARIARTHTPRMSWRAFMPYAIAAAVALLVTAIYWWQMPDTGQLPIQMATLPTEVQSHTLADGSQITLNRNSGLTVQAGFNKKERRLALRGEAYFEVAPDKTRPFIVSVNDLEVKVLGTAFNVDNNSDPNRVIISVTHGKVSVQAASISLLLTAGEQAVYDKAKQTLTKIEPEQQDPNAMAYKNKVLRFDAAPLSDVVKALNKVYGVKIEFRNPRLESCRLTARYNDLSIDRVMELIAASFSIKATRQNNETWLLEGNSCGE
ncbi:MAG: FecR domain-containing protein [Saprospiraceae bacterium]|nr:FecR domain-containing protein [Saprospiraceae bacterium]